MESKKKITVMIDKKFTAARWKFTAEKNSLPMD